MIGRVSFRQTLVGSWRRADEPGAEHPLSVSLAAERARVLPPLSGRMPVVGEIDARGLADHRPLRGTIEMARWKLGATVYELDFSDNQGQRLRLVARREPRLRAPLWSLSHVLGAIEVPGGARICEVELRLDYRDTLGRWLQ